jgi:sucrose-6F-phosphate phosphohydrolase
VANKWLFVSDVDDTLLGDDGALELLSAELKKAADQIVVAYNSSRPCASLRDSLSTVSSMLTPDYLIGGMGTQIEVGVNGERLTNFEAYLEQDWDRDRATDLVSGLNAVPHPERYQTSFKISFDIPGQEAYQVVKDRLAASDLLVKAIFSAGKFLDLIAVRAGKGEAVRFLQERLGISAERVVVAGDSGNDVEMFLPDFRGIVVGNADDDLKRLQGPNIYKAKSFHAAGILEGLRYWGVLERGV